jgi:hypothetical protein
VGQLSVTCRIYGQGLHVAGTVKTVTSVRAPLLFLTPTPDYTGPLSREIQLRDCFRNLTVVFFHFSRAARVCNSHMSNFPMETWDSHNSLFIVTWLNCHAVLLFLSFFFSPPLSQDEREKDFFSQFLGFLAERMKFFMKS